MTTEPRSLRSAIDAKCKGCIYDSASAGAWREQVACCTSSNCPLFEFRPMPERLRKGGKLDVGGLQALRADIEARNRA